MIYNLIGMVLSLILLAYLRYVEINKKKESIWLLYPIVGTIFFICLFLK